VRNRVQEQRAQRGLSQAELATALGVSRRRVISIENGASFRRCRWPSGTRGSLIQTVDKMFDPDNEETGT